jgi:hypothetical protein
MSEPSKSSHPDSEPAAHPNDEAAAFQHSRHQGEKPVLPHSLKDQVKKGDHNANTTGYSSQKTAEGHTRDHTLLLNPEDESNY